MIEEWEDVDGCEVGPLDDEAWVVESMYDIPIKPKWERKGLSYNTCKILLERYPLRKK